MDLNYKVTTIFPTCIHSLEIDNFDTYRDQLIKESYQNRDEDPMGRELSIVGDGSPIKSIYYNVNQKH